MQELFVGVAEVAERLGVSSDTVTRWCRQGRIPGIKPGRDWRVPASVAEDLLAGRPARFWTADLEPQLARLRASDHVLVLVPGGVKEARAFRSVLLEMGHAAATPEPPPPPVGRLFAQAMLRAGARALASREVAIAHAPPASPSEWLIRWVGRLGGETLATETSVSRAAEKAGRVIFCLLPLTGDPDLVEHDPNLAGLVEAHTHILVGQAHGRSWLGSARASARLAGVS
ncbi:MAG TPA: helix-turn-helix domain-containing protein [Actinomycetota bacterium]|nr:helix-turn-helix domain-containing protein [Actinomycetota bacterium]